MNIVLGLQPLLAWAEDRALLGSTPSADPGAKTGAGVARDCPTPASLQPYPRLRDWHQSDKPSRQDAATSRTRRPSSVTYADRQEFQFTVNQDTLVLDIGALYGSLVGATEQNVRQALKIADAMAPCILYTDEIDKGISGVGGQGDSGVATRLFGTILTWLADHESDVFFIGTANDVSKLPPEFTRAERLDAIFFLDTPSDADKTRIWSMYLRQFGLDSSQRRPRDASWTGAEIRACCRLAALLDQPLLDAAKHIVPVAVTASESVERLRRWASGRCLSAETPGVYGQSESGAKSNRNVNRGDPTLN